MNMHTILVVDDEPSLIELLKYNFQKDGYGVLTASNGESALEIFRNAPVSLVILDIMMPGMDGLDLCREIRTVSTTPVILLTARDGDTDKVVGFELGADDYVTKPFSILELKARVKALLRRSSPKTAADRSAMPQILTRGDLRIDRMRREVVSRGKKISLTTKEFDLLFMLASSPGIVFPRDRILDKVWGNESYVVDRAVDVHIRHLREKIEIDPSTPRHIITLRGVGYRFES